MSTPSYDFLYDPPEDEFPICPSCGRMVEDSEGELFFCTCGAQFTEDEAGDADDPKYDEPQDFDERAMRMGH